MLLTFTVRIKVALLFIVGCLTRSDTSFVFCDGKKIAQKGNESQTTALAALILVQKM